MLCVTREDPQESRVSQDEETKRDTVYLAFRRGIHPLGYLDLGYSSSICPRPGAAGCPFQRIVVVVSSEGLAQLDDASEGSVDDDIRYSTSCCKPRYYTSIGISAQIAMQQSTFFCYSPESIQNSISLRDALFNLRTPIESGLEQ